METILTILKPFFDRPDENFHIREIARITKINHTTARKYLNKFKNDSLLTIKKSKPYNVYCANTKSKKYLNLKLYHNLEKIRKSGIIQELEETFDYPVIVLFGSYAKALDNDKSDIDLFILSDIKKEFNRKPFEKFLKRHISFHSFSNREFIRSKEKNPDLINNICNGITISSQLEIL